MRPIESSTIKDQIAGIFPVDTALPALEVLQRAEYDLRYATPTEKKETHTQTNKRVTITPENVTLPPAAPATAPATAPASASAPATPVAAP